jgi:ATP:guanido phosphotransferase, C-terminal catalytic domain
MVIKSLDKRGNVRRLTHRLQSFLSALHKQLQFSIHPEYGYLSVNPGHAGVGLQASLTLDLPNLAKNYHRLRTLCDNYDIIIRRQKHFTFELATFKPYSVSEFQLIAAFFTGVRDILELEKGLK